MKEFLVRMPIVGVASIVVEAEDEESAIDRAIEDVEIEDFDEWEAVKIVCQGNFFYGSQNEVEVSEEE